MSTSVSDIRIYDPSTAAAKSSASDATSTKDMAQNFLKMLTVQLQNQDPLNPMDNASMTSQLAALNTVDGINKLNDSMASLVAQMQAANFMNLPSAVGKSALAAGDSVYFGGSAVNVSRRNCITSACMATPSEGRRVIREAGPPGCVRASRSST